MERRSRLLITQTITILLQTDGTQRRARLVLPFQQRRLSIKILPFLVTTQTRHKLAPSRQFKEGSQASLRLLR